jgi:hypothetical protein
MVTTCGIGLSIITAIMIHGPTPHATLEVDPLGNGQRVIHFDPEIADGALQLRMAKPGLDGPKVARLAIDQRRLGPAQRLA